MIVVGIDPSLTATGVAIYGAPTAESWYVTTIKSAPVPGGDAAMMRRIRKISEQVNEVVLTTIRPEPVSLIVIEAPAFSKNNGMAHERAGLWWMLYEMLTYISYERPLLVVKPNLRAKYATGKGVAGKDQVVLAASRRYYDAAITNNNECDAVVLAAMGARYIGAPLETALPATHLAAMKTLV